MFKKLFGKNKGKGKSLEEEVQQDQVKNTPKVENQPYQNKKNKPKIKRKKQFEMTREYEPWEDIFDKVLPGVHDDFYSPLLEKRVILEKEDDLSPGGRQIGTAYFDFITDLVTVMEPFLDSIYQTSSISQEDLADGIMKHEWGHYVVYPRDVSSLMFLRQFGEQQWKGQFETILAYWVDVMDNLPQILKKKRGRTIRELYKAMTESGNNTPMHPEMAHEIKDMGSNPEEIEEILKKYSLDRLVTGYYQWQSKEDLGIDLDFNYVKEKQQYKKDQQDKKVTGKWVPDEDKFLEEKLADLLAIPFVDQDGCIPELQDQLINYTLFGQTLKEVMDKLQEELPEDFKKQLQKKRQQNQRGRRGQRGRGQPGQGQPGQGQPGQGQPGQGMPGQGQPGQGQPGQGMPGQGQPGEEGSSYGSGDIMDELTEPQMGYAPNFGDFRDDQIEDGLDQIIRKFGKKRYDRIKKYVEEQTGKEFGSRPTPKRGAGIGLSRSSLTFHDDQIPYYMDISRTYGIQIHKRPIMVDEVDQVRNGVKEFRVGDPINQFSPFGTGGRILPGISNKHNLKKGSKADKQFRVPHKVIWIDSSGSMPSPQSGSPAITAGYVLARNYWANGAHVGVVNFSVDTAFLLPTRELYEVYSMLTAFWNGGTAPDLGKIKAYMKMLETVPFDKRDARYRAFTSEDDDVEQFLDTLSDSEKKQFMNKDIEVSFSKKAKEMYEKVDTSIITDGGIYNIEEVIGYINQTGQVTRNTIFMLQNRSLAEQWSSMNLPNTTVIPVDKNEDLTNIVIGNRVRNMM